MESEEMIMDLIFPSYNLAFHNSKLLAVLEMGQSDLKESNMILNPHFHLFSALQKPHITFATSIRLDFAPLHIRNIAVRAGPEVRQISNWKVDCHSHLGCHHDHSDIVTKQCENKECCTSSLQ
jgi:hypothetical protein